MDPQENTLKKPLPTEESGGMITKNETEDATLDGYLEQVHGESEAQAVEGIAQGNDAGSDDSIEDKFKLLIADAENDTIEERPSWRESEIYVGNLNPDYEAQKSFLNGEGVSYGTKGSSRPDFYTIGSSIEVKNYNVTTTYGRNALIDTALRQVIV